MTHVCPNCSVAQDIGEGEPKEKIECGNCGQARFRKHYWEVL